MSELQVRGLSKSFGEVRVLHDLDLDVGEGSVTAVLGASGCGKTTLLRLVAGFEAPDAGTIEVGNRQVAGPGVDVPPERRRVGLVPQEGLLFPHLDVAGNVGFGLPRGSLRAARVAELLEVVGLEGMAKRRPNELSGGQQQRVALARALAPMPDLVLLDEPFNALDASLREAVRSDVRAALHAVGATAVLVTHDQEEAMSMADSVAIIRDGRVVQSGSPRQIYAAPVDAVVAQFVGEAVLLPATVAGGQATTALGRLDLRLDVTPGAGRGVVVIRPEQVLLVAVGTGVPATVEDVTYYGHDSAVRLLVSPPGQPSIPVLSRVQGIPPEPGAVAVRIDGPVGFLPD
jgi:iron(III) transport system ATP-binding protein